MRPRTRYAEVGDAQVAYQVFGDGPIDLVLMLGMASAIDHQWDWAPWARVVERLASFSRVIQFDRRGTGSSDPVRFESLSTWEHWAEDVTAVLDAVGSTRAALCVALDSGPLGLLFAATNPERVSALIILNSQARGTWADDYPIGLPSDRNDIVGAACGRVVKTMGDGVLATFDGPGRAIRCAVALRDALTEIGLPIYVGLHTGEVELRDDDIGGMAVHIASRVMAAAAPGEIVCSRTVRDLVIGSHIQFEDRGVHALKGVPDDWPLYAVVG